MNKHEKELRLIDFIEAEEEILESKAKGIRVISHSGEKGRAVEHEIMELLRSFLPSEYGLSTGFIAYHDLDKEKEGLEFTAESQVKLSTQIDIIIYDALRSGPIIRLGSCAIFPIEAVYGYVECKLSTGDIQTCLETSNKLRQMRIRKYWKYAGINTSELETKDDFTSIRPYLFIVDGELLGDPIAILKKFNDNASKVGGEAFMTAYILNRGFYRQKIGEYDFDLIRANPLLRFKTEMLEDLSRFPRIPPNYTPAINVYFPNNQQPGSIFDVTGLPSLKAASTAPSSSLILDGLVVPNTKAQNS